MVFAQRTLHLLGMSKESALILEDRFEEALMLAPSMELPSRIFSGLNETAPPDETPSMGSKSLSKLPRSCPEEDGRQECDRVWPPHTIERRGGGGDDAATSVDVEIDPHLNIDTLSWPQPFPQSPLCTQAMARDNS